MEADSCWRREAATNERECPPSERDLVECVGVKSGTQTMIGRRSAAKYSAGSGKDQ